MAEEKAPGKRGLDESMLASATMDRTPQVGLLLSSFNGGEEHDGTKIAALPSPRPVDAVLSDEEQDTLLKLAVELSRGGRRGRIAGLGPEDWVVLKITLAGAASTDLRLLRSLLEMMISSRQGRRFTIVEDGQAPAPYVAMLAALREKYAAARIEYVNLATAPYLEAPAVRRTYAARNPGGVYAIPKVIRECDKLITIGPLRTSPSTGVALSASSFWPLAPAARYGVRREKLMALGDPVDILTDLYLHHPPDYAILGGPIHMDASGKVIRHNIVIAGSSALAVDAVGADVMGFDPRKVPLLDKLEARGFGVRDTDSIWTHGNEIEDARRPFQKPAEWRSL